MPAPLVRSAQVLALLVGAALAVVGGLALRGPGLVTVLVTATVVGTVAAGLASEGPGAARGRILDAGGRAAGWTAGVLLVLAGLAAVAGVVVTLLVAGAVATAVLVVHLRRARSTAPVRQEAPVSPRPSVPELSCRELGEEWLQSTALLEARVEPALRRAVVDRRVSILDELERRDGTGFARWLAEGPTTSSNPADHVRDLPAAGTGAA
ncbi:hypothetical protein DQ239_09270 [Blastococcus sp. TF02-09]|uniref:hypothetical protein n=1 Tax=Blastococcus sp. TF02-09 TaxID=2250576 RepID=UPI000DE92234|nr:hypothetical protein [Blastococcus sp. TF02-9]RBY77901.1 hypothetical protein DQ239_09270 [Blastococcus sp. TF02-9]